EDAANRGALIENLRQIAENGAKLECILVDECQDYSPGELEVISSLGKRMFFVGDDHQEIFGRRGGLPYLEGALSSVKYLRAHYRNGRKICRVADAIQDQLDDADGLEATSQYDENAFPSTVLVNGGISLEEQVD